MNGLVNLGNTCYLNAALQMILNIKSFKILLKKNYKKSQNLSEIYNFIDTYESSNNKVINPNNIKNIIGKRKKMFGGYSQNDSVEAIIFFFDVINNELEELKLKDRLEDIIGITSNINVKCKIKKCLQESEHKEKNLILNFIITDNLNDSYRDFKNITKLEGDNKYECENCNKKTIARKKHDTVNWNNDIIISLKRFNNNLKKNNKFMNIPINWRHGYTLIGGIIHSGDLLGGHYYYFGKKNNSWYIFNDSHISKIESIEQLNNLLKMAYVLHYHKN